MTERVFAGTVRLTRGAYTFLGRRRDNDTIRRMRTDAGVTGELQVEAPPRVEEVSPSKNRKKTDLGLVSLVSAAILIPCFWQRHIQAGDLASHVYNAWLAQLVGDGGLFHLHGCRQVPD